MNRELDACQIAERSLIKKYRKVLWNPFIAAVKRYQLVEPGDRIAVCISGGKDSMGRGISTVIVSPRLTLGNRLAA